jgi:hypothetical protein
VWGGEPRARKVEIAASSRWQGIDMSDRGVGVTARCRAKLARPVGEEARASDSRAPSDREIGVGAYV